MRRVLTFILIGCVVLVLPSCKPSEETGQPARIATKEDFFREGHRLFLLRERDSAEVLLRQVVVLDSTYQPALKDLAELSYDRARDLEGKEPRMREAAMQSALGYVARLEAVGQTDAETYERLCELSLGLRDYRSFLRYAKRNAEKYPYDRQYYNLGIAYFEAGDFAACVKSQKEAVEKFKWSNYIGGFYRQMGRAYMKMDRDQTAERTLGTGVQAADARLAELRKAARGDTAEIVRRLADDKISMLLLLKRLHTIYRADDKLQKVEQQLKDAGYGK
jgi:tetratricopeptide (TPR) repeat protein